MGRVDEDEAVGKGDKGSGEGAER